uniref:Gustatory receptor n=1 Tax=Phlebotomus papatasi TaxID=29031 RepID=A0A3F2ZEJ3_PHLPP
MTLTETLGYLLTIQKFITIPNFTENFYQKKWITILRILPILIFVFTAICDGIYAILYVNIPQLGEVSALAEFVIGVNLISDRLSITFILVQGVIVNGLHIRLLKSVKEFEDNLVSSKHPKKQKKCLSSNIYLILNIILNLAINSGFYVINNSDYDIAATIRHHLHVLGMLLSDFVILYLINFIKHISVLAILLLGQKNLNETETNKLFQNSFAFISRISLMNSTLGGMLLITFFQYILSSSLAVYFVVWLIFGTGYFPGKIFLILTCLIWILRSSIHIIYLSILGNNFENKIQKLSRLLSTRNPTENESSEVVEFNRNQFLMWSFHAETRILAGGYMAINNSGIFSILSFIVTCLVVLLQFKQMEDYSRLDNKIF